MARKKAVIGSVTGWVSYPIKDPTKVPMKFLTNFFNYISVIISLIILKNLIINRISHPESVPTRSSTGREVEVHVARIASTPLASQPAPRGSITETPTSRDGVCDVMMTPLDDAGPILRAIREEKHFV